MASEFLWVDGILQSFVETKIKNHEKYLTTGRS